MKERTDDEILAKLKELWPDDQCDDTQWKVNRGDGFLDLTVQQMYDVPGLSFDKISTLSEFFDTMKVETEEEIREGGCETCDYGSRYGFVLRVSSGAPYQKLTG